MPKAVCLIREQPHYRRDAFMAGLQKAGFTVLTDWAKPKPDDVLVIWNRYGHWDGMAAEYESAGAAVIVAENGYLGNYYNQYAKPYDRHGNPLYALSLWYHNGAGEWPEGPAGRWIEQGIEVEPWRWDGVHVLLLPQRGIGPRGVAMPMEWVEKTMPSLQAGTKRPVRIRSHPGNEPAKVELRHDLQNCWCAVTWGSGAALKAICAGIPVFSSFKKWIGRFASLPVGDDLESPLRDDMARDWMLDRLSWAQWSIPEIMSGTPFVALMDLYRQGSRVGDD